MSEIFSPEYLVSTLKKYNFIYSDTAKALRISTQRLEMIIKGNEEVQELIEDLKDDLVRVAEAELYKLVRNGDFRAIKFVLENNTNTYRPKEQRVNPSKTSPFSFRDLKQKFDNKKDDTDR